MDEMDGSTAEGPAPIRVLIVEDHAALGEALLFAFGFEAGIEAIGVAPTIAAALERVASDRPDVVLMDVRLPDGSGLDAAALVQAVQPGTAVVVMTAHADHDDALRAADAGAAGFILKDVRIAKVVAGVRRAVAGEPAIDPTVLQSILNQAATEGPGGSGPAGDGGLRLTPPERDLVGLLAAGAGRDEVTGALGVGADEVAAMTASLQERLGARSVLETLVRAARTGLWEATGQGRAPQPRRG